MKRRWSRRLSHCSRLDLSRGLLRRFTPLFGVLVVAVYLRTLCLAADLGAEMRARQTFTGFVREGITMDDVVVMDYKRSNMVTKLQYMAHMLVKLRKLSQLDVQLLMHAHEMMLRDAKWAEAPNPFSPRPRRKAAMAGRGAAGVTVVGPKDGYVSF